MRALFTCLLSAMLLAAARGQYIQEWESFEVVSHLDNAGRVRVVETLVAHVNGKPVMLDRLLVAGTDGEIVFGKIVRVVDGADVPVADVRWSHGELYWRIRADDDPEWVDAMLTFRLEYEVRGAVQPAWDIPAGPGTFKSRENFPHFRERWRETLAAWREPAGRWRFDHDSLFARFESEGPRSFRYTFKYDDAWRHPNRDRNAPLNTRVTPDVNYRVTELRDYLPGGNPAATAPWKAAVRVGSIAVFAAAALGLWLIFAVGEVLRRGWFGPRVGREWFAENIASVPAEVLVRRAESGPRVRAFPLLLARWRRMGMIEVRGEEDDLALSLRGNDVQLPPHERKVLAKLFPNGREITTKELGKVYAEEGFDPGGVLDAALDARDVEDETGSTMPRPSWFWKLIVWLVPALLAAGVALMLVEAFTSQYADSFDSAFHVVGALIVTAALAWFLPVTLGGVSTALAMLVPVAAMVPGLLSLHFYHTIPLLPAGAAGVALLALACVSGMLLSAQSRSERTTPDQRMMARARRFVRRELRRKRPRLEDVWVPQIIALGCAPVLDKWRARPKHDAEPGFTGGGARPEELWEDALGVVSAQERREFGEEE